MTKTSGGVRCVCARMHSLAFLCNPCCKFPDDPLRLILDTLLNHVFIYVVTRDLRFTTNHPSTYSLCCVFPCPSIYRLWDDILMEHTQTATCPFFSNKKCSEPPNLHYEPIEKVLILCFDRVFMVLRRKCK